MIQFDLLDEFDKATFRIVRQLAQTRDAVEVLDVLLVFHNHNAPRVKRSRVEGALRRLARYGFITQKHVDSGMVFGVLKAEGQVVVEETK